jgi:phage FluMu protein Com
MTEVRCPACGKKLAEDLQGKVTFKCPGCKQCITIDNRVSVRI